MPGATCRGSARDAGKLEAFDEFVARMQPDQPPAVPYLEIDNRAGTLPLNQQIAARLSDSPTPAPGTQPPAQQIVTAQGD